MRTGGGPSAEHCCLAKIILTKQQPHHKQWKDPIKIGKKGKSDQICFGEDESGTRGDGQGSEGKYRDDE